MKHRYYYYLNVYVEEQQGEDYFYDPIGYLQKDSKIGYKSIFTTTKELAMKLAQQLDKQGYCAVVCDIRDEKDQHIKKELLALM